MIPEAIGADPLPVRFQTVQSLPRHAMNIIIYIVGLVVIVGAALSYFGLR